MIILFCDSVIDRQAVEPDYEKEYTAAKACSWDTHLISHEELVFGNVTRSLKFVPPQEKEVKAIYRGWMLNATTYALLYEGLKAKNILLINDPKAYKHCHYLPESYKKIEQHTPRSVWSLPKKKLTDERILELTQAFGTAPIVLKDYVKSEKHYWKEACFIPNAADAKNVLEVTRKFLELRGSYFNEGVVFRAFETLEFLTDHSQSGMPLTKEFRLFFANQELVSIFHYWDEGEYGNLLPPTDTFEHIARTIESNFFTMDVAQKENGEWIIMELGDGQVSGLPENANVNNFYTQLSINIRH